MHKRLAALPSRQAAEHRRGGGREMVSIPWVEGRTVAPPRASPPAARYARASCSRAPEVRKGGATCLSDSSANGRPTRDDSAACEILASTARAGQQRSATRVPRKVVLEPAPPLDSLVPAGTANNSSYLQIYADPLVRSDSTAVEWQRGLALPLYAACVARFCAPPAPGLSRYFPATEDARAPVLPSLFLPGFPKSATTWLFNCMLASFAPSRVGCGTLAANWTAATCGRRFLLTALRSDPLGQLQSTKETFYFGGNLGPSLYDEGLLSFHGPDPRPPSLDALPSLWPWEAAAAARASEARRVRRGPTRLREATRRIEAICPAEGAAAVAPRACLHRSTRASGAAGTVSTAGAASSAGAGAGATSAAQQCAAATDRCAGRRAGAACSCSARGVGGLRTDWLEGLGANSCTHPACTRIARAHPTDSRLG